MEMRIVEYIDENGKSPFEIWFNRLKSQKAAKVATSLYRMEQNNFSNVKGVGEGVFERKINFGPGYRVYFGKDGSTIVVLLCGGTKKQQSKDIVAAKERWKNYKKRKRRGLN